MEDDIQYDKDLFEMSEDEFNNLKILDRFRTFLQQHRLEGVIKKNVNGKEIKMKKPKGLNLQECDVFTRFLDTLMENYFELLQKKH